MEEKTKNEDRRVKKTRNAINEAFQSLLLEKKYSYITVKEVTDKADITRKTFYLHYDTLDDVLREFLSEILDDARDGIINSDSGSPETGIPLVLRNDDYSELFDRLNRNFEKEHLKVINLINDDVGRQFVHRYVMERQKLLWEYYSERYKLSPDVTSLYITFMVNGMMAMYMFWYNNSASVSSEEFLEMTHDISACLRGLLIKWQEKP